MAVNFYLADKNKEKTSIYIIVRYKGKRYKRSVNESVETAYWNNGFSREVREYPHGKSVNKKLKKWERACDSVCDTCTEKSLILDNGSFWKEVDLLLSGAERNLYFVDYFKTFIDRHNKDLEFNTIKKYITALNKISEYEQKYKIKLKFENVNMSFYNKLKDYMFEKGFSDNYFGSIIKCVKKVYKEAKKEKLHTLNETDNEDFKVLNNTSDSIYLNSEELKKIFELQFTPESILNSFPELQNKPQNVRLKIKSYEVVRNKFLVGCCTALRVSDFNRLSDMNIKDNFIKIKTKKTKTPVVIPINAMLRSILDSGFDLTTPVSDQKINEHIKEICKMAGINEMIEITTNKGGKDIPETHPKYELVTTHTARRSGATNMYKAGIPTLAIMKITGHKTEKAFMKYIKITEEENAEMLANHPYFKN